MDIRSQVSMVFHLDKCIGCHTCSIACKNIWTDRKGTEYMYWNNVETKPGTGYPTRWEDQTKYRGGWVVDGTEAEESAAASAGQVGNADQHLLQPLSADARRLFRALDLRLPEPDQRAFEPTSQPTARAISMVTGKYMDTIEAGPNWDDDLGGSQVYANNDPNFDGASDEEMRQINEINSTVFFYLPRICNHCLNPGCVAACPQGAIYKRGEDGVVLVSQERCRAWRMCVSGCPYKKTYFNWSTGKAEKCILCYPRLESGQPPACFHSCVGRIRYIGLRALRCGCHRGDGQGAAGSAGDGAAQHHQGSVRSGDHRGRRERTGFRIRRSRRRRSRRSTSSSRSGDIALPLHPEFRTLPMLFYVPPLGPVLAKVENGVYDNVAIVKQGWDR